MMLENPQAQAQAQPQPPMVVKRYAPPNQRNRSINNRRKSSSG